MCSCRDRGAVRLGQRCSCLLVGGARGLAGTGDSDPVLPLKAEKVDLGSGLDFFMLQEIYIILMSWIPWGGVDSLPYRVYAEQGPVWFFPRSQLFQAELLGCRVKAGEPGHGSFRTKARGAGARAMVQRVGPGSPPGPPYGFPSHARVMVPACRARS